MSAAGNWRAGLGQLVRSPRAVGSLGILLIVVLGCVLAPVYAWFAGNVDPFAANPVGTVMVHGVSVPLLQPAAGGLGVVPVGPTGDPAGYLLGADGNGRDIAVRVLYGGRNTLSIGFAAAVVATIGGLIVGLLAGYLRGVVDVVLSRILDVVWAFPVLLLAISLSAVSFQSGLNFGLVKIGSGNLALPIFIIGAVYIPYTARVVRGSTLELTGAPFVEAAVGYGASRARIVGKELLPNVFPRILVLFPVVVATGIILESGLSFLGVGVRAPDASWGTIVQDGIGLLRSRPLIAIVPGAFVAVTVCALNVFGDAVRDAFDPKAAVKVRTP
ncbi:ABC transporter permease [Fodinicola feengrottensis]|uniref:ABC transporter permease n=1 Tax=Fodinicola feengrottensis TaxID=435914 RepID=UPI0031CF315C